MAAIFIGLYLENIFDSVLKFEITLTIGTCRYF